MSTFEIGQCVENAARPEWGVGKVTRVQPIPGALRVSVQFPMGHRVLLVPPAELIAPRADESERQPGWIEQISGRTVDDRLRNIPAAVAEFFGTPLQRAAACLPLYAIDEEDPHALVQWARRQTSLADPLSHWSRDELLVAFRAFCQERDAYLRGQLAIVRQSSGLEAVHAFVAQIEDEVTRERVTTALRKPL